MMMKCPSCGSKISQNAKVCPQCKCTIETFRKPEMKPCRSCGASLAVKEHCVVVYQSDPKILDRSPVSTHTKHVACPKCGDPRPLDDVYKPNRSGSRKWLLIAAAGLVLVAAAAYAWMKFGGH